MANQRNKNIQEIKGKLHIEAIEETFLQTL